jgi:hypothetical protein
MRANGAGTRRYTTARASNTSPRPRDRPWRRKARADGASTSAARGGSRAVTHDLGALELRADDERRQQTAESEAHCHPGKGAVRLRPASSSGRGARFKRKLLDRFLPRGKTPAPEAMFRFGVAPRGGNEIRRRLREASAHRPGRRSVTVYRCAVRYELAGRARASKAAKSEDFERLRYSSCPDTGKMVRHPIRRAVFSLGRASRSDGWA